MKKKKILFVVNSLWGGGAERVFQTLLTNFNREKHDVTVLMVNQCDVAEPYPVDITYRYIFGHLSTGRLSHFWLKVANKIKLWAYYHCSPSLFHRLLVGGGYDVEVAFIEGYATRVVSGAPHRCRKLAWLHIDLEQNPWTRIAYPKASAELDAYKAMDMVACVSRSVEDALLRLYPGLSPVMTIYNPVDENKIIAGSHAYHAELPAGGIRLVSVGRLEPQKGYDRLLPIIKRLVDDGADVSLTLVGEGNQRQWLSDYIAANGLEARVKLTGFVDNPYPWMAGADLFVASSRAEGYSTVVTEALILGLPVVTTRCAGMDELLDSGRYGLITENDEESLYRGLRSVIDDAATLARYRCLASERGSCFKLSHLMSEINRMIEP